VEGVKGRSINDLIRVIDEHFSTCFECIDDDGSHVSETNLEDWPFIFGSPVLTDRRMILWLKLPQ
jgi:hypothetical protein